MSSQTLTTADAPTTAEAITERFDPTACLDERVRHEASIARPLVPGCYIEIQGPEQALLIELGEEVMHIGRGLSAELRLDDASVSRRHAILVPLAPGARILDDRSSNGTFVNGSRIEQHELCDGDEIAIGRVLLRYVAV
jgi:FHA domain